MIKANNILKVYLLLIKMLIYRRSKLKLVWDSLSLLDIRIKLGFELWIYFVKSLFFGNIFRGHVWSSLVDFLKLVQKYGNFKTNIKKFLTMFQDDNCPICQWIINLIYCGMTWIVELLLLIKRHPIHGIIILRKLKKNIR